MPAQLRETGRRCRKSEDGDDRFLLSELVDGADAYLSESEIVEGFAHKTDVRVLGVDDDEVRLAQRPGCPIGSLEVEVLLRHPH